MIAVFKDHINMVKLLVCEVFEILNYLMKQNFCQGASFQHSAEHSNMLLYS